MNAHYGYCVSRHGSVVHANESGKPLCGKRSVRGKRWNTTQNKVTCRRCLKLAAVCADSVLRFREETESTNAGVRK